MTTQEVANRFNELSQTNQWHLIQAELFADDCESIEPANAEGMQSVKGIEAIRQKGEMFNSMVAEMHGGFCTPAVVGGNFFSVGMGMDVTMKEGGRMNMAEVCLYEVKNGKIIKEQFFY